MLLSDEDTTFFPEKVTNVTSEAVREWWAHITMSHVVGETFRYRFERREYVRMDRFHVLALYFVENGPDSSVMTAFARKNG